jgi:hypothetical protein
MSVIPITVFFSLLLAAIFIVLFAHEQRRRRFASLEQDSLLPLAEEQPLPAVEAAHDHDEDDNCGCRDGTRPPCAGCRQRAD